MIENVCNRPWTFERVPNKMLPDLDSAHIFTATKEACLASCLNEVNKKKKNSVPIKTQLWKMNEWIGHCWLQQSVTSYSCQWKIDFSNNLILNNQTFSH